MKMYPIVVIPLLIGLVAVDSAVAQQAPTPVPLVAPPGPVSRFPSRFDVVDAPERFEQVLQIIDFPAGAWTPLHSPGGSVYSTVIEGEISTRQAGPAQAGCPGGTARPLYMAPNSWLPESPRQGPCPPASRVQETSYRAGDTFFAA